VASEQRVTDPRVLRAIAHPIRLRLLSELSARGPSRAADLALELGEPANSVSFHLRQLAKYGLIEEAPERARDRRDRWWQATADGGTSWSSNDFESKPGGPEALAMWRNSASAWTHEMIERFFSEPTEVDKDTVRTTADVTLRLTKAEAEKLGDEVSTLLERWANYGREQEAQGKRSSRRSYLALTYIQPYPK
jgi:predicted ArsR family transcriptional regulator